VEAPCLVEECPAGPLRTAMKLRGETECEAGSMSLRAPPSDRIPASGSRCEPAGRCRAMGHDSSVHRLRLLGRVHVRRSPPHPEASEKGLQQGAKSLARSSSQQAALWIQRPKTWSLPVRNCDLADVCTSIQEPQQRSSRRHAGGSRPSRHCYATSS
jgi:hypothetical protein